METQWQRALEILTSPNQSHQQQLNSMLQTDAETSPENNDESCQKNAQFETPKTSKSQKSVSTTQNNLNCKENKMHSPPPMDRLQAYIELVSPRNFKIKNQSIYIGILPTAA